MISPNGFHPQQIPGSDVRVVFSAGSIDRLGEIVSAEGGKRVLLVSDPGIRDAGHEERAVRSLYQSGLVVKVFDEVGENPTVVHVGKGVIAARPFNPDVIVGLGGGSAMDCGKGINFILTNGGRVHDYWGVNKAHKPLLPFVAIPTTAGTGSDAQSAALITDPDSHQKMACWDRKALPRLAILDPELTATQPPKVAAATGIDAIAHAVESVASTKRSDTSRKLSLAAWQLLEPAYERAVKDPSDVQARERMLLGAHLAGAAIENSMLGAAHALANGLTAVWGTMHGVAVGLMLPHVVRFNAAEGTGNPYSDLGPDAERLARRLEALLDAGGLPKRLSDVGAGEAQLAEMSRIASTQWTATFNPRKVGEADLLSIYRAAL
jgi:alcohol dehydrogenase